MLFAGGTKGIALDTRAARAEGRRGRRAGEVHRPRSEEPRVAHMLVEMPADGFPVALGVLYDDPAPTFDSAVIEQNAAAAEGKTRRPPGAGRQGPDLDGRERAAASSDAADARLDNLTHCLAGWALGQAGLKRKTRKGLAALILGANMPDIDVFFGWRRGSRWRSTAASPTAWSAACW